MQLRVHKTAFHLSSHTLKKLSTTMSPPNKRVDKELERRLTNQGASSHFPCHPTDAVVDVGRRVNCDWRLRLATGRR